MKQNRSADFFRSTRRLTSLVPAVLLFVAFFAVILFVRSRLEGGVGLLVGIGAGGSLVFGALLVYYNAVDRLNLRLIRKTLSARGAGLRDGEVVAFDGFVRTVGDPMVSPFGRTPCAAYTYVVSYWRSRTTPEGREGGVVAEGFHMVRTRIEGASGTLELRSFPSLEDEFHASEPGTTWGEKARELIDGLYGNASSARERSRLLELRTTPVEEAHHDYVLRRLGESVDRLVIDEEVLPAGRAVTVIGTYDRAANALIARRSRLGPNLYVYPGRAQEVLSRIGKENAGFAKATATFLGFGGLLLGLALAPASLTSKFPLIGRAVIAPPETEEASSPLDPVADRRARVDAWIRGGYADGNHRGALEIALEQNAHETLRWLLEQGIPPDMPIRVQGEWHQLPLVEAARLGHLEVSRVLLEAGANPNAAEPPRPPAAAGDTALGVALEHGDCPVAQLLLDFGAALPEGLESNPCG